jgi:hypothetical protein
MFLEQSAFQSGALAHLAFLFSLVVALGLSIDCSAMMEHCAGVLVFKLFILI